MSIAATLKMELEHEAANTRKVFEVIPEGQLDFKPHPKSFTLRELASHIAEAYGWTVETNGKDHFDMDPSTYVPFKAGSVEELLAKLDENLKAAMASFDGMSDEKMMATWKMTAMGQTIFEMPRAMVLRAMILNHIIHHRGQLTVYLRLNDVALPSIYGPTADEQPAWMGQQG